MTLSVRCEACGTTLPLHMTATPERTTAAEITMRFRVDDGDLVMLRLFAESHRGAFGS